MTFRSILACAALAATMGMSNAPAGQRVEFWIDLYTGEPVSFEEMLGDLVGADVVFLGERHTVERHHRWQETIVKALAGGDRKLVLGLEMLETRYQPQLDRYGSGEIDFAGLAAETDWAERWDNYEDYRGPVEAARKAGAKLLALNADAGLVRRIGREGLEALSEEERGQLPAELDLDDKPYFALLEMQMMVHAHMSEAFLNNIFAAQVARDATMADSLASFLESPEGKGRRAVVLLGAGHCSYGYGTVSRLKRRLPDTTDRIVIMSESGDVELPPAMAKYARDIEITHQQLRDIISRPLGDYLSVIEMKPEPPAKEANSKAAP